MSRCVSYFCNELRETSGKTVILLTYWPSSRCWKLCQKSLHSICFWNLLILKIIELYLIPKYHTREIVLTFRWQISLKDKNTSFRKFTNLIHTPNQQLSIMHKKELSVKFSLACSVLLRPIKEGTICRKCSSKWQFAKWKIKSQQKIAQFHKIYWDIHKILKGVFLSEQSEMCHGEYRLFTF